MKIVYMGTPDFAVAPLAALNITGRMVSGPKRAERKL